MERSKTSPQDNFINPHLLLDVLVHTQRDLSRFNGPDAFKTGGHLCFWISRLKPFRACKGLHPLYTNETLGLTVGLSIVRETQGPKPINCNVMANLIYNLRYGHSSPVGVSNEFQLLYS